MVGGVVLLLFPIGFGVLCLLHGETPLSGRGAKLILSGLPGAALAIAYLSIGIFLQFHWFWASQPRLEPARLVAALLFVAGLGYALFSLVALWFESGR